MSDQPVSTIAPSDSTPVPPPEPTPVPTREEWTAQQESRVYTPEEASQYIRDLNEELRLLLELLSQRQYVVARPPRTQEKLFPPYPFED